MADLNKLNTKLPESPLTGSSYVGAAVLGTAFGASHPGVYGCSFPPPAADGLQPANLTLTTTASSVGDGVYGQGLNGVHGSSAYANGVLGETTAQAGAGVSGVNNSAWPCLAISGASANGHGVKGVNGAGSGQTPTDGCGVWGDSNEGYGVYGASKTGMAGVFAGNVSVSGSFAGAGAKFSGDLTAKDIALSGNLTGAGITLSGDLTAKDVILSGADCAEEFDLVAGVAMEPGCVMAFDDDGAIGPAGKPYDRRVVGVVSGAGAFRPGIILDRRLTDRPRAPIALVGKVYCKVDAAHAPIAVGDPLTTSSTLGCAMKATDPALAFGAVIGKALAAHAQGIGLIPILVSPQ